MEAIDLSQIAAIYVNNEPLTAIYAPDGTQIWPVGSAGGYSLQSIRVRYSGGSASSIYASGLNYAYVVANLVDSQNNIILQDIVCNIDGFSDQYGNFYKEVIQGVPPQDTLKARYRGMVVGAARTCTITAVSYSTTLGGTDIRVSATSLELTVTQAANAKSEPIANSPIYVGKIELGDWDRGSEGDQEEQYAAWGPLEDGVADTCGFSFDASIKTTYFYQYSSGAKENIPDATYYAIPDDLDNENWFVVSDKSWCVIVPNGEEGDLGGEIRITEENTSGDRRSARLKLMHGGAEVGLEDENEDPVQVYVTQNIDES